MNDNSTGNPGKSGFVCLCCGVCCRLYQPRISITEANSIADNLEISLTDFITQFTDPRWPGRDSLLLRHSNLGCVFLEPSADGKLMLCSIHSFKPDCCLEWQSGVDKKECQEGLRALNTKNDISS